MKKIKVYNPMSSRVTVNLKGYNNKTVPIAGFGSAYLMEDEVAYVANTSKVFEKGILQVVDKEVLSEDIYIPESNEVVSKLDIENLLKKPFKQLTEALEKIDNIVVLNDIFKLAKDSDKPAKTVELIEKRISEVQL